MTPYSNRTLFRLIAAAVLLTKLCAANALAATVSEPTLAYQAIEIDITGPQANETDDNPNPFLDIRYELTLTSPSGKRISVPGFFAGDGQGNGTGNVWRARFSADETGTWQYSAQLFKGQSAAIQEQSTGLETLTTEQTGSINVVASENAKGFERFGRLSYVGEHYLKFSNGPYWIKGGVDSPENFFGYSGFDNTVNQPGGVGEAFMPLGLHHYTEHVSDWETGDPLFSSDTTGEDSKGIIGAVNYLASQGVNSMYFLLMNLGGDGRDTYPFLGASGSQYDNTHYDVSKLRQWNTVLEHMQRKGIAAHFVLAEQEAENQAWLDGGELGVERKLFYREMVARFTYLNALKWNISEESRYGDQKHIAFAQSVRGFDWAEHPIAVHSFVDGPEKAYKNLIGNALFSASSIQFHPENADEFTEHWRERTAAAGVPWVIDMDEVGPGNTGLTVNNAEKLRRDVLYPVYFSGGNIEWYFGFQGADIRTENFRIHEPMFRYMRFARTLMEQRLPFWEMEPLDEALIGADNNDQVFAKPGETYAVYLNQGNVGPTLNTSAGQYNIEWFNPRTGVFDAQINTAEGPQLSLGTAPSDAQEDWVVVVSRVKDEQTEAEIETDAAIPNSPTTDTPTAEASTTNSLDSSAEPEPELGEATAATGSGATSYWYFLLLLCFRGRSILPALFNMLSIKRIKIYRV